jgi:tetratricopeptide (TPR) repeat protein
MLGEAYLGMGDLAGGRSALERALDMLGYGLPRTRGRLTLSLLRQLFTQALRIPGLRLSRLRRVPRNVLLDAAAVYERLAELYYFANQSEAAFYSGMRALNLAEAAGPSPELARSYANVSVGVGLTTLPVSWLSRRYARFALDAAERAGDDSSTGYVNLVLGVYHAGEGHWDEARAYSEAAVERYRKVGDGKRLEQALSSLGHLAALQGDYTGCVTLNQEIHTLATARGDPQMQASALVWQATGLLLQGAVDDAAGLLAQAEPLLEDSRDEGIRIIYHGMQALLHQRARRIDDAVTAADVALATVGDRAPASFSTLVSLIGIAGAYLDAWDRDPAGASPHIRERVGRGCEALEVFARTFPIGKGYALLMRGRQYCLQSDVDRGIRYFKLGLAAGEKLHMPHTQGRAHMHLGRYLSDPAARRAHLERAYDVFRAIDAVYDLPEIQAQLDRLGE